MMTSHDSSPKSFLITVDGYQFDFVVPGTYLRPQVLVSKPKIDIVDLNDAYLEACDRAGVQADWELTTDPDGMKVLDPGFWRVGLVCNEGWDVDHDLSDHLVKNQTINVYEDPVEFDVIAAQAVIIDDLKPALRRYVKSDSVDSCPVVGCVVRIYETVSLAKLGETLKLLGVAVEITADTINVDADILMSDEGEIDFDLPGDAAGGSLSLHPRNVMQQHAIREYIDREAKLLVQKHLNETTMTISESLSQEPQADDESSQTQHGLGVQAFAQDVLDAQPSGLAELVQATDGEREETNVDMRPRDEDFGVAEPAAAVPEFTPVAPLESASINSTVAPLQSGGAQPIATALNAPIQSANSGAPQAKIKPLPSNKKNKNPNKPLDPTHFGGKNVDVSRLMQEGIAGRVPRQHPVRSAAAPVPSLNVPLNTRIPTLPRSSAAQTALKQFAKEAFIDPTKDGIDHINLGTGQTDLGRWLNFNARTPFALDPLGEFASIGALWVYLRCAPEERAETMRMLAGTAAREKSKNVRIEDRVGLYDMIADATWVKINTYEERVQQMLDNRLPYLMYIVNEAGDVIHTPVSRWYLDVIRAISDALKQAHQKRNSNILPDFSWLTRFEQDERKWRERIRREKEDRQARQRDDGRRDGGQVQAKTGKSAPQQTRPSKGPRPAKVPRLNQVPQARRDDAPTGDDQSQDGQQVAA